MSINTIGKTSSKIPREKSGSRPLSSKQTSGSTQFNRMTTGSKAGGMGGSKPSGMPTVHQ